MTNSRLKRIEQRRKILKFTGIIVGIILLVCISLVAARFLGFYRKIHTEAQVSAKDKKEKPKEKTEYTILLLGYGGGNHDGAFLTDTIMLANVDLKEKNVLLVSVPRDIWVKVPTKTSPFHSKINAVYQMGLFPKNYPDIDDSLLTEENGSALIKKVIENITGMEVDAFAAVDFQGFIKTIDTLGGIEVDVKRSFTDYEYPIEGKEDDLCGKKEEELPELEKIATKSAVLAFPCRYETLTFEAGETHMDGKTALKFARSRHSLQDGGDFNRAQRQQQVLEAVKNKVLNINFIPKILPLMDKLEEDIITDLPLSDTNRLLLEARNANQYNVTTFVISDEYLKFDVSENGQSIVVPTTGLDNWSAVKKKIQQIKQGITPTPTQGLDDETDEKI